MKKKVIRASNAVGPAAPASVWGYKGCAGKGGKTLNSSITHVNENDNENEKGND